jgi:cephalosporin hydroxylase
MKRLDSLPDKWRQRSVLDLWHSQVLQHHQEMYKGIGIAKFPQDLWTYEKLINTVDPEVIIEIGVNEGGFTRWLYDRLLAMAISNSNSTHRTIIGLDINIDKASLNLSSLPSSKKTGVEIVLSQCDLLNDISLRNAVRTVVSRIRGRRALIIEDSGHTYATTKAALDSFGSLLSAGEWFIVEDTCVDIEDLRECPEWPRGALNAADDFLRENADFERTNFNEKYEITCHPYGFLRKKISLDK